ncbi:MAG: hypothetical protein M0Z40_18525 [Actinomycetota bacterium]|nr:hypothetical protein [Actinomycetota bacterium]
MSRRWAGSETLCGLRDASERYGAGGGGAAVQHAGAGSWRAGIEDSSPLLDVALFVRDACGLEVPGAPGVPPLLTASVPDHSDVLSPALRGTAVAEWVSWWDALVAHVGAEQLGMLMLPASTAERLDTLAALHQRLFDWPELQALERLPALRAAVQHVGASARRFANERKHQVVDRARTGRGPSLVAWATLRDVAEATIKRFGVLPERVRAGVVVLDESGKKCGRQAKG